MTPARGARALALAAILACGACGGRAPSRPAARPALPAELLPADLDVVARVDVARARAAGLGDALATWLPASMGGLAPAAFAAALPRARTVWIGTRWAGGAIAGDAVVAIEGDASTWEPADAAPAATRWAAWREARGARAFVVEGAAPARGDAALLVHAGGRGLVVATPLELDAVAGALDAGRAGALAPAAEGIASVVVRVRGAPPVGRSHGGALAERLCEELRSATATVDRVGGEIVLRAELLYADAERARGATERLRAAADALAGAGAELAAAAAGMRVEQDGPAVRARIAAPIAMVAGR